MVLISRDRLVQKAIRKRMDEKSYREENFSFSNLIVNKSHFLIFELQLQLKKIFKNSVFSKNNRLCSRQNRVVIWPTDLTARDLLSRCVMFCWSMTRIALLFFICDQRNTAMFRFVSFRFVIFRFANLRRWICYAFFFYNWHDRMYSKHFCNFEYIISS